MIDTVTVGLGQIAVAQLAPAANLEIIDRTCRVLHQAGAELLLLPELANIGQVPSFDRSFAREYARAAEALDGPFERTIAELARELGVYVAFGMAERHPVLAHAICNSAVILAPSGERIAVQRKLHLPGEERHYFARGDSIEVVATDIGVLTAQICYDLHIPEVARFAALQGAEVLLGLANIPHRDEIAHRIEQLASVRAYENMQHVAIVNRVGSDNEVAYGGGSVVACPPGVVVARAPLHDEHTVTAQLTDAVLLDERMRRPVFADLRPDVYRLASASFPDLSRPVEQS